MTVILLKMVVADPDDAETAVDLLNDAIDACPRAAFKLRTRPAERLRLDGNQPQSAKA